MGLEPASVRPSVHPFTLSNMNISETSRPRPIEIKFHLEHPCGGGRLLKGQIGSECWFPWQQIASIGL